MIPLNDESHQAIDATVDRALSALAQATPAAGMEARILSRLRQSSQTGPSTFTQRIAQLNPRLALAGAFVFICLLAVMILRPDHRQLADYLDHPVASDAAVPPPTHSASINQAAASETPALPHSIHRDHPAAQPHLVSFPAPPEPLTEQERLLLAVAASHPSPDVVAALDPVQRAESAARSDQQFLASLAPHDPNTTSGDPR